MRIEPPPRDCIDGTARRTSRSALSTSSSNPPRHASSSKPSAGPAGGPPVFVKSRSTPPNRPIVSRCQLSIAAADLRSAETARTSTPCSSLSLRAASSIAARSREAIDEQRAFRRQRLGHAESEPFAGPADHRNFPAQVEVHASMP